MNRGSGLLGYPLMVSQKQKRLSNNFKEQKDFSIIGGRKLLLSLPLVVSILFPVCERSFQSNFGRFPRSGNRVA